MIDSCQAFLTASRLPSIPLPDTPTGAFLSPDRLYRYRLWRIWHRTRPIAVWCMLNPSTASEITDDPTIRRCLGFAQCWGCGGILIVNLFAARATDPRTLATAPDPIGPENDDHLRWAASASATPLICAWGAHPLAQHGERANRVQALLRQAGRSLACLGTTAHGHPRHPLYLPSATPLETLPAPAPHGAPPPPPSTVR